jgi:TrmH family RNA methyltransferase
MIREITSSTNPFIKHVRALATSKKARQESGSFIVEGWRSIQTLLEHESSQYKLEHLVLSETRAMDAPLTGDIDTVSLPDHLFEKVSDVRNAQGILGVVRHLPVPFEIPENGNLLLLDNLRDPGNLGTLIRSAVGAGFAAVLLYGDCVEPFNPKVIRSTMGTFAYCPIHSIGDAELKDLTGRGFDLCVTTGLGGTNLYQTTFGKRNVLVIGSEAHGASAKLMQNATKKITIPLVAECESLNAAIAGSICMFHIQNA